jgi:hypothetical protein
MHLSHQLPGNNSASSPTIMPGAESRDLLCETIEQLKAEVVADPLHDLLSRQESSRL